MGMQENWNAFVLTTKAKDKSHMKAARYWDCVNNFLSLLMIFLAACTTFLALLDYIPSIVVAGIAGVSTLVSTVGAFIRAPERRQVQTDASKVFKTLMMKMVRCEEEAEYESLWKDYNKALLEEPFLPKKYITTAKTEWTMTPELFLVIREKEEEVRQKLREFGKSNLVENIGDKSSLVIEIMEKDDDRKNVATSDREEYIDEDNNDNRIYCDDEKLIPSSS